MEQMPDGYGDDLQEELDVVTDESARQVLVAVDLHGKLRPDNLEDYATEDELDTAFEDLERAGLAIEQREITDTGAEQSYEITFNGEQFLDAVKYEIEGVESAGERYSGELDDRAVSLLETAADPVNRMVLDYLESSDTAVEFRELRLYAEERGIEDPYKELRSSMTEMEDEGLVWTQDEFDPEQGNVIECGLYTDGEDLVQGLNAYRTDGAVQRPDTGADRP